VQVRPFEIAVPDDVLEDLRERLRRTRWPDSVPDVGWEQGMPPEALRGLLRYWAEEFDWPAQERRLNSFDHFQAEVDGVEVHFVHAHGAGPDAVPLICSHGWPGSFIEFLELVPLLTDPASNGIEGPSFELVIPSLPGYGFTRMAPREGVTKRFTASLWHRLMRGLGYERYGAHGGDFGAGVANFMALDEPASLLGIHLTFLEDSPWTGGRPLSSAERAYREEVERWEGEEYAYGHIQRTKPQTLAYGLNDSPAGLAAWILEKWRSWSDSGGELERRFDRELLLTVLTIYWVTGTIGSSMRWYWDERRHGHSIGPGDFVSVPTAMAVFANEHVSEGMPPREWAERLYDIRRWTVMPRGGHFAALEEPRLLAEDIAAFFGELC
jgi:pimeloyl-ACP methyl ester carboxylesterase